MTNRQRLIRTLCCQATDRPPFPWWMGFVPWGETLTRWRQESGLADLSLYHYFGFEPFAHEINVEYGPLPHFDTTILSQDDEFVVSVEWRGITRRDRRDYGSMPEWLAHPVTTPDDWQRYKAERLQPLLEQRLTPMGTPPAIDAQMMVGRFPWGVFGTARDLLGAEPLLYGFYDHPEMIHDIMQTMVTLWLSLYEAIAQRVQIDHIHIWEDMSGRNGSLISSQMLNDFMMPQYDRIAAFAKTHAIPVISVDSDGDLSGLAPVMAAHGVNAFMPFEVQAGSDILDYRRQYPNLGLMGGLDKGALAADRSAMHRQLDRAQQMFAQGGYIVGFDHLIPPNVPWANYKYFLEQLRPMIFGK